MQDHPPADELNDLRQRLAELEKREAVLRRSEERYRSLFDRAVEGIFQSTPEGRFIRVNAASARMCGFASPSEMIDSITDISTQHYARPENRDLFLKTLAERGGRIENFEHPVYRKDGSLIWVSVNAWEVRDPEGNLLYLEGTHEDITQRREMQEALRESEALLRNIFNFLPDSLLVIDREGKVIAWNRAIEELTGVPAEEMIGRGNFEYALPFYGERRPILIDLVLQPRDEIEQKYVNIIRQGEVLIGEAYMPNLRGGEVYLLGTATALYDQRGRVIGAIETIRDITGRRKAEEALKAERERLTAILDGIPVPAFMIDRNRTVLLWNRYNEAITGLAKEGALGRPLDFSALYDSPVPPTLAELILTMTDGEILERFSGRGLKRSAVGPHAFECIGRIRVRGEERIMSMQAARIVGPDGEIVGAIQTAQDITERVHLETRLRQAQKMEAIGTLAGGIAHDFNNLLMGIQGYASLMLLDMPRQHAFHEKLRSIQDQVRSGADLTRQLLSFARGGRYEAVATDLNEVVRKTSTLFGRTRKELRITGLYARDLWIVEVDHSQIEQVLLNLYVNAWQAMPGGGDLHIETKNVTLGSGDVQPHDVKTGHYVKVSVTDTGVGMDERTRQRIFEPFFTTKEMGRGTGLGLATVYGILRGHGGFITVSSEMGRGSSFTFYLPVSEKVAIRDEAVTEEIQSGKETILLVDDEKIVLEVTQEMLETMGYRVLTALSGAEAIDLYRTKGDAIDLIIIDMVMPALGGGETYDALKAINPDVRVILSSGYSINGYARTILDRGVRAFIQKPFSMSNLSLKIRQVMDQDPEG